MKTEDFGMSMISKQVKELRELADDMEKYAGLMPKPHILREAANAIEALSAKLAAANMERSDRYYGSGGLPYQKDF